MPRRTDDDPWKDPQAQQWLSRAQHQLRPMIEEASMSAIIGTDAEHADAKLAVELGYSILLDKPLIVLVPPDRPISKRLRKVADVIVDADITTEEGRVAVQEGMNRINAIVEAEEAERNGG